MSGLEIFGIIGSAISVIEGIIAAKSYTSDLRHSTKEREQIKNELQRINSLVVSLQEVISSMPRNSSWLSLSQAFNDFKLSLEKTQNVIQESSKRVMWTADKAKIRVLQNQYERLGTILSISFTSYNTQMSVNQYASSVKEFDRINTNLDSIRLFVDIERLHAIQNWLTSNYLVENELSDLRQVRMPHSGDWLLESDFFQNWLAGRERVAILDGPPGCGKTILSTTVVDNLEHLGFHYFPIFIQHSSDMTEKTVLCRILSIALGRSALSRPALGLPAALPSELLLLYQRQKLEETDIRQITSAFLRSIGGPLYIVIDALDELSTTPRNNLIFLLIDLSPQVRLFITTRPLIVDYPHASYSLRSSDLCDIRCYVYSEVEKLDYSLYGEEEDVSSLKELVLTHSSEIFLLASLHIRELRGCLDMEDALEVATKLPTTDKLCYSHSIDRIRARDTRRATTALHCLVWVWQAKRKLTLDELQTAVASSTRDLTNRSVSRSLVPRHQLLDLCDGLLVMNDRDEYVVFVHLTARQYFDEHADPAIYEILPSLGVGCLGYLNALHSSETVLRWHQEASKYSLKRDGEGCGFFDYASRFWGEHPLENGIENKITALLKNAFLFSIVARLRAAQITARRSVHEFHPSRNISWLHIAASFGLTDYLFGAGELALTEDSNGLTLLHYAVLANKDNAVGQLLQLNVLLNGRDCNGVSSLSYAAYNGHDAIVCRLLDRDDIEADSRDNWGNSPLTYASLRGHIGVVRSLLERTDIAIDLRNQRGASPLYFAATNGHIDIVRILLEQDGVEADSRNGYGSSPLSLAAFNGHIEIVRLLLPRDDVDADSRNQHGSSPLNHAAINGHIGIVRLLLERNDVEADSRDNRGGSPLIFAAMRGHVGIVLLLLARVDVEADSRTPYGASPLWFASESGHAEVVRLLLARDDVEADSQNIYGVSPLAIAAEGGHIDTVRMLLARDDVKIDSRDKAGMSPLGRATENGHRNVVDLLLRNLKQLQKPNLLRVRPSTSLTDLTGLMGFKEFQPTPMEKNGTVHRSQSLKGFRCTYQTMGFSKQDCLFTYENIETTGRLGK